MIGKRRAARVFDPINIVTSVEVQGNLAQVYDVLSGRYLPSRATTPLKLVPRIYVCTAPTDTTWSNGYINRNLSQITWYVNGQNIATVDAFRGKYSIDTSSNSDSRGTITINLDVPAQIQYELTMSAVFTDSRTGDNYTIHTDIVSLFTTEHTIDEWDMSVVHDVNIKYHPLLDKLKEYDWKVKKGIIEASDEERAKCLDGNQYDLNLPIIITRGKAVLKNTDAAWNNCDIELYVMDNGEAVKIEPEACLFLNSLSKENINLDLRLIPDGTTLLLKLVIIDGEQRYTMGQEELTFTRIIDNYTCEPMNESAIKGVGTKRFDKALCMVSGRKMDYPEAYLQMKWYTQIGNNNPVYQGEGESVNIDLGKAGMTLTTDAIDVYVDSRVRSYVAAISVGTEGKVLVTDDYQLILTEVLEG